MVCVLAENITYCTYISPHRLRACYLSKCIHALGSGLLSVDTCPLSMTTLTITPFVQLGFSTIAVSPFVPWMVVAMEGGGGVRPW